MKKRILSMLLMLTMVCSLIVVPNATVASAASYYDTVDTDCELAVDVLSALGIMGGYTDGSFLPYNTITRAEMVSIAVKLAGLVGIPEEAPDDMELFNDMYDYDGWAGGVIALAKAAGIARSDDEGNFNPELDATYEDALQMVVSAIGYGHQAISRGGSLNDYVYVAQRLGLTKKLSTGLGQNITRSDVAKLVYRALTVDLMQPVSYSNDGAVVDYRAIEGENALNTYFDVYEVKGVITDNEFAAIDGEPIVNEMQVLVNGEAFNIGSTDINNYLGYYATVYALESDDATENRTVIAYSIKNVKNNTMTILDENIEGVSVSIEGFTYEYWTNKDREKKPKQVETSTTPLVMYNGQAVLDVTEALLVPDYGHVVLIDNNGDDKYDIVDVWEYDLVYVFSASQTTGSVSSYYDRSTPYKFDAEDDDYHVTFLNPYGGMAQQSEIKQYSVLYVYESLDKSIKKVIISNNQVRGEVQSEDSGELFVVNGTEYKLSPAVEGKLELAVLDSGVFYLDADNRIAGFEGATVIRKNIGMFIAVNDGGLRRGYQMKVLTSNSGVQIFNIASTVKVNDYKMSAKQIYEEAFYDHLFGTSPDPVYERNGIKRPHPGKSAFLYKLNSDGEICEMTVVGEDNENYLQSRELGTEANNYLFYSAGHSCLHYSAETTQDEFGNTVGKRTYCDKSTINFLCEETALKTDDNQSFFTKYINTYWDNYNFEFYDYVWAYYYSPDESEIDMQKTVCNFIVMANWYDDSGEATGADTQNTDATSYQDNTPPKFIQKITQATDRATGEPTYRVYYFDGTSTRNSLIRPIYSKEAFLNANKGTFYPNGFPVRISTDGSYIEDIAPYFDAGKGVYRDMETMIKPVFNVSTSGNVMPIMPFHQQQHRKWNSYASNSYYTQYFCGVITSIDEVVNKKLFNLAYASKEVPGATEDDPASYVISYLSNERLEGNVFKINLNRAGEIHNITRGSLEDIVPGQLVLVRKRAYDADPKWHSLTGYAIHEFYIISEDASELDYLSDFYNQLQAELGTEE